MNIHVNVTLASGDNFDDTPDAAAAKVLAALGGDADDYCTVFVSLPTIDGSAGTPPAPPEIVPPPVTPSS